MKYAVAVVLILGIFIGCNKVDEDEVDPIIESMSINQTSFAPQDVIEINVGLRDDQNLNQVRVRIEQSFAKSFGKWETVQIREISGQTYQGTFSFTVPDTAQAGYYEYSVQGADLRGNGTIDSSAYFTILQPGFAPQINNFQTIPPIVDDVIYMNPDDTLSFSGFATDDYMLQQVSFDLRSTKDVRIQLLTYNLSDSLVTWDFAANVDSILPQYDEKYPASLIVKVLDSDNNQTRREFPIDFIP